MAFPNQKIGVNTNPLTDNIFFRDNSDVIIPQVFSKYIVTESSVRLITEDGHPIITET